MRTSGLHELKYYRPLFVMNLNNAFRFKHSLQLEGNMNAFTCGNFTNIRLHGDTWNSRFCYSEELDQKDVLCLHAKFTTC